MVQDVLWGGGPWAIPGSTSSMLAAPAAAAAAGWGFMADAYPRLEAPSPCTGLVESCWPSLYLGIETVQLSPVGCVRLGFRLCSILEPVCHFFFRNTWSIFWSI